MEFNKQIVELSAHEINGAFYRLWRCYVNLEFTKNNIACSLIIGHLFGNFILESTGKGL